MSALLTRPPAALSRPLLHWRHAREWVASCALVLAGHALLLGGLDRWPPPPGLALQEGGPNDPARLQPLLVVRTLPADPAEKAAGDPGAAYAARLARAGQAGRGAAGSTESPVTGQVATTSVKGPALRDLRADPAVPAGDDVPAQPRLAADAAPPQGAGGAATAARSAASPQTNADTAHETAIETAAEAAAATGYAGAPPPVWTTRLPGDFALAYAVRRGEEAPRPATLRFESREGRYTLQLQVAAGVRGPEQASHGRLEPGGLAPERYVDRRRARAAAAANFDPAGTRITYSGAAAVQPLFPGTQDRLSWLVQIAAVLEADPVRAQPGVRLPLYVSGARGDAQLWTFEVRSPTPQEASGGMGARLVHLVREPERPYDLRVEVWLDPAQHHLPARLRLTPVPAGAPLEWWRLP